MRANLRNETQKECFCLRSCSRTTSIYLWLKREIFLLNFGKHWNNQQAKQTKQKRDRCKCAIYKYAKQLTIKLEIMQTRKYCSLKQASIYCTKRLLLPILYVFGFRNYYKYLSILIASLINKIIVGQDA